MPFLTCHGNIRKVILREFKVIAAELPYFCWGAPSFLDFALSFDLYALPFGFSEIYLFYCAFSQIIPRKVYLRLAKKAVTFFLFMLNFLKIYQSELPSFLGSIGKLKILQ